MRRFRRYTSKALLIASALILSLSFLAGCLPGSGGEGGGFDLVKFLQNPFVMIIIVIIIVWFMWKHKK